MSYKNLVIKPPKYTNNDGVKESQFYKGFSTVNDTASVSLFDYELIRQDLINRLSTARGERVMNPNFGTIIWHLIYDPLTDQLRDEIKDDLVSVITSDPRISPVKLELVDKDYGILVEITLAVLSTNQIEKMSLTFDRELGLIAQ
jgi:phage baseplate assembly protein W